MDDNISVEIPIDLYNNVKNHCENFRIELDDFIEDSLELNISRNEEQAIKAVAKATAKAKAKKKPKKKLLKNKTDIYSPINLHHQYKEQFPAHIIFIQSGVFYEVFDEDAESCEKIFYWKVRIRGDITLSGIHIHNIQSATDKLEELNQAYILIPQTIDESDLTNPIQRHISTIYPEGTK